MGTTQYYMVTLDFSISLHGKVKVIYTFYNNIL